jgi:DNA polymerase-3 subunit alpha
VAILSTFIFPVNIKYPRDMFLIYDTETTGLPRNYEAPVTDLDNWPRLVQLAWQLHDARGNLLEAESYVIKPENFTIPFNAEKIHGITTEFALREGADLKDVLEKFTASVQKCQVIAGHNVDFDQRIVGAEYLRTGLTDPTGEKVHICTKTESIDYCALPGGMGGGFKWPQLGELHQKLFDEGFAEAHNASADVIATARCFFELLRIGLIAPEKMKVDPEIIMEFIRSNPGKIEPVRLEVKSLRETRSADPSSPREKKTAENLSDTFCHLHVHSQYSILQATPDVKALVQKAAGSKMPAVALTDLGNMYGAYAFVTEAEKANVKPIVGCELFISRERLKKKFTRDNPDIRHNQVLLAKNLKGYQNLSRLTSLGYVEGLYGLYPRVDKELIEKYREGLIATTGGLASEIPELILNVGETQAEEAFRYWHSLFGEDFYVQLNRHGLEEEERVNEVLLRFAGKYQVKYYAANNVFYLEKEDSDAQDILLCILNAEYQATPVGYGRGHRFGFPNQDFYFKGQEEMKELFRDLPEAIDTITEIVDKVEVYSLDRKAIMPDYPLPEGFDDLDDYLRHQTMEGAKERYGEVTPEIMERIDFELDTIHRMGYPGYFLIVQDILDQARKMGVSVGPGRGSAAGSVVAYCLKITDVDPIQFNLLFERFLNPDRISLPDIDIDFDEDGRDSVLKWVVEKYGSNRVAQIITFGKMAPKMAIRDIARVKQLPLNESDRLSKLVPGTPGITFKKAYASNPDLDRERKSGEALVRDTLVNAEKLEGTIRNTGTHACGIIIGRDDLIEHIPLSVTKDSDMLATQYDGGQVEHVGMLKMDFLGLKTLAIIKDTIKNIKRSKGIDLDIEAIPFDDAETYALFSRGDTNGIFQFESEGMKKHLRDLKPNRFEDLIAMNALYRPGPMEYIPNYIRRKHGKEKIEYDIPEMEEILKETYGITVYQEQVMLLSQKLAGFTKGQADSLRKGMGKKKKEILDDLQPKFIEGAKERGHDEQLIKKIWVDWEAFANYAFNKSHSTCYAVVSYRMAFLKAHHPAEFMAAVLSRHLSEIKKITFFIDECKHLNIPVLGPDINESSLDFIVNQQGKIRFGMAAIKGIGEAAVQAIIEEREANGPFSSIFDFAKRANLKAVNKRAMEALAYAGAFDGFENTHRAQYFYRENSDDSIFLEKVIKHANLFQDKQSSAQHSLFGDEISIELPDPSLPDCEPWSKHQQLKYEKEVTGFYISGHPLDERKTEIDAFCSVTLEDLHVGLLKYKGKAISFAGMVMAAEHRTAKTGNLYGTVEIEDFTDTFRLTLWSDEYLRFRHLLLEGTQIFVQARVEASKSNPNRLEVKVNSVTLLAEIMEKFAKKIVLDVPLSSLNEDLAEIIHQSISSNAGKCELAIRIRDNDENYSLGLFPRKGKVNPSGLARDLLELDGVELWLNGNKLRRENSGEDIPMTE